MKANYHDVNNNYINEDFLSQVLEKVKGLKSQQEALKACGMQPEFASQLMLQNEEFGTTIILRAGHPPIYDRRRSPKSGLNLSKTSNQGFFKGYLAKNPLFTRLTQDEEGKNINIGHNEKDLKHLKTSVKSTDHQHCLPLSVNMQDILKELSPSGDLDLLKYDNRNEYLYLKYKKDKGDRHFKGQFILKLNEGKDIVQYYTRPWEKPENNPNWDDTNCIIKKPDILKKISKEKYAEIFYQEFKLYYTDTKATLSIKNGLKPALVFANTPRTASDFLSGMDPQHPYYKQASELNSVKEILKILPQESIIDVYDKTSLIITGDWDGLALGHPPHINQEYNEVYNTFDTTNPDQEKKLKEKFIHYFQFLKNKALDTPEEERNFFDKALIKIHCPEKLISDQILRHAGCITPHEFLFQQLINFTYRSEKTYFYYKEVIPLHHLQLSLNQGLLKYQYQLPLDKIISETLFDFHARVKKVLVSKNKNNLSEVWMKKYDEHLIKHLQLAINIQKNGYIIPHLFHDPNVQDLFQHGFDMRNPYGCNLNGAWLMITGDGALLYGETQEQLVQVMLTGKFLEKNLIDINHNADMKIWGALIKKQIELNQKIPAQTLEAYNHFLKQKNKIKKSDSPELNIRNHRSTKSIHFSLSKWRSFLNISASQLKNPLENTSTTNKNNCKALRNFNGS